MNIEQEFFAACESGDTTSASALIPQLEHIDIKNEWTRTGLAIAVRAEHFDLAKLLVSHGASIQAVNRNNTTIFMFAKTPVFKSRKTEILEWLLAKGADINALDIRGLTVLDYVQKEGDEWMLGWMQQRGAKFASEL